MRITDMHVTPIALGDPPLLNAAGLHAPYCLRTIVELHTNDGLTGLAEVPGSVAVDQALLAVRDMVVGADPLNWHALRAHVADRCAPETSALRGDKPWDGRTRVQVFSALEVACLDIAGKAFDVLVATLLGGIVRDRVPYSAYLFYKYEGAGGELAFGVNPAANGWAAGRQAAALDPAGIVAQTQSMVHPLYILLAIGFGSKFLAWMNDAGFWVVSRIGGLTQEETLRSWTPTVSVISIVGLIEVLIVSWMFPALPF